MRVFLFLLLTAPAFAQPDILILGEVHDNPDAHLGQAAEIAKLGPKAVVFEMLTPEEAAQINIDPSVTEAIWSTSNWPPLEMYGPIFDALDQAAVVGAAVPRETVMQVYRVGPVDIFGERAAQFGLDRPLPSEQQKARETLQFEAHCEAMPLNMMAGMVSVQRFRDAVFAQVSLEALATYGAPIAVITGNGHARMDWGIPAVLRTAAPEVTVHTIGFVEGRTGMPFNEVRAVPVTKREDPCATLTSNE